MCSWLASWCSRWVHCCLLRWLPLHAAQHVRTCATWQHTDRRHRSDRSAPRCPPLRRPRGATRLQARALGTRCPACSTRPQLTRAPLRPDVRQAARRRSSAGTPRRRSGRRCAARYRTRGASSGCASPYYPLACLTSNVGSRRGFKARVHAVDRLLSDRGPLQHKQQAARGANNAPRGSRLTGVYVCVCTLTRPRVALARTLSLRCST